MGKQGNNLVAHDFQNDQNCRKHCVHNPCTISMVKASSVIHSVHLLVRIKVIPTKEKNKAFLGNLHQISRGYKS